MQLLHMSADEPRWRQFAERSATSPLQLPAWLDVLIRAYRLHARVLALSDGTGTVMAALPMIRSKLPWRRGWTSLPFTDMCDPVALSREWRDQLLAKVADDATDGPILVRTDVRLRGWTSRQLGTVQVIDVSSGAEGVMRDASSATRRNLKRAQRGDAGLSARPITGDSEFLGSNLDLTVQSRRRLGAPTQPRRYWEEIWGLHARGGALTVGVYLAGRLVASGVFVLGERYAVYKYGASDSATWELRPNHLMFATAFDELAARGVRTMDFGMTDLANRSLREFKRRWGGEEKAAHYSATDPRLLPDSLEPGRLLTRTIQHSPALVGRGVGALAYPLVA
jgi:CelD/BcsL family acetyltransferase involved in cellulose biosynthesis